MPRVEELVKIVKEGEFKIDDELIAWVTADGNLEMDISHLKRDQIPQLQSFLKEWYGDAQ